MCRGLMEMERSVTRVPSGFIGQGVGSQKLLQLEGGAASSVRL